MLKLLCIYSGFFFIGAAILVFLSLIHICFGQCIILTKLKLALLSLALLLDALWRRQLWSSIKLYIVPKCIQLNTRANHAYEPKFQLPQTIFTSIFNSNRSLYLWLKCAIPFALDWPCYWWRHNFNLVLLSPIMVSLHLRLKLIGCLPLVPWHATVLYKAPWLAYFLCLESKCTKTSASHGPRRCSHLHV